MEIKEACQELLEEVETIYDALYRIKSILRQVAPGALNRAEAYWLAHIDGALLNRDGYLGTSMITFADTLAEIEGQDE